MVFSSGNSSTEGWQGGGKNALMIRLGASLGSAFLLLRYNIIGFLNDQEVNHDCCNESPGQ